MNVFAEMIQQVQEGADPGELLDETLLDEGLVTHLKSKYKKWRKKKNFIAGKKHIRKGKEHIETGRDFRGKVHLAWGSSRMKKTPIKPVAYARQHRSANARARRVAAGAHA